MKPKQTSVICHYAGKQTSILQIVQSSFDAFLKKELQYVEKYLPATV